VPGNNHLCYNERTMNFAFFGTDEFSVKVLEILKDKGLVPSLVITTPDKPRGRKMVLTPPPVKVWAEKNGIEVVQPINLRETSTTLGLTKGLSAGSGVFDFFLVASYGQIIPPEILDIPTHRTLNLHPSLLPKYRGPSPLETAILNGDIETGVTIMKLDAEMDHGPILASEKIKLNDKYNFEGLRDKLAVLGAELLAKILPDYLTRKITSQEQNHSQATYTKKFTKEDGFLEQQDLPLSNYRKILALNPWPGTYLDYPGPTGKIRVIIKQAHLESDKLIYDRVTPAGKKEMVWADFLRGLKK